MHTTYNRIEQNRTKQKEIEKKWQTPNCPKVIHGASRGRKSNPYNWIIQHENRRQRNSSLRCLASSKVIKLNRQWINKQNDYTFTENSNEKQSELNQMTKKGMISKELESMKWYETEKYRSNSCKIT